jgi:hypothetical protein
MGMGTPSTGNAREKVQQGLEEEYRGRMEAAIAEDAARGIDFHHPESREVAVLQEMLSRTISLVRPWETLSMSERAKLKVEWYLQLLRNPLGR